MPRVACQAGAGGGSLRLLICEHWIISDLESTKRAGSSSLRDGMRRVVTRSVGSRPTRSEASQRSPRQRSKSPRRAAKRLTGHLGLSQTHAGAIAPSNLKRSLNSITPVPQCGQGNLSPCAGRVGARLSGRSGHMSLNEARDGAKCRPFRRCSKPGVGESDREEPALLKAGEGWCARQVSNLRPPV